MSPDQIVSEVVRAARAEKITDVTEMPKNLSDRNGLRVQIRCKRGGNVTKLIADLMRHTSLRVTIGINLTVVADGVPRQLDLREIVDRFVSFRFEVVTRRLEHERNELLRELHRLVALLAALDAIDAVIRIVRNAEDDDDAREKLKSELRVELHGSPVPVPIDDEQAQYILDMPIKRLSRLNRFKLQEERETKGRRVDEIGRILDDYDELREIVVRRAAHHRREARRAAPHAARRRDARGSRRRPARLPRRAGPMSRSSPRRAPTWCCSPPAAAPAPRGRSTAASRACRSTSAPATRSRPPIFTDTESELNAYTSDGQVLRLRVADVPIESRVSRGVEGRGALARLGAGRAAAAGAGRRARAAGHRAGRDQARPRRQSSPARTWADRRPSTCPTAIAWSPSSPTATATRSCCTRRTAARCGSTRARCGRSRARRRAAWPA